MGILLLPVVLGTPAARLEPLLGGDVLAAFSVTPIGAGDSVWGELSDVIQRRVEAVAAPAPRVSVVFKLDRRPEPRARFGPNWTRSNAGSPAARKRG